MAAYVSPESCKNWEKTGKIEFIKLCRKFAESGNLWSVTAKSVSRVLYDLCRAVIRGNLKTEQVLGVLREIIDSKKEIASVLTDVLTIIDVETSCLSEKYARSRFLSLVSTCQSFIPASVLKERLDQDTLEMVKVIPSKLIFQQKYVKTKTRLYYKQQKFNLLREESEGFGKLITELNQEISDKVSCEQVLENIKSLIGCFNLEPNRVLDVMLESFECRPDCDDFYVPLFRAYLREHRTLCHILGFKFHFYLNEQTPASLYKVAALLLKHNLVKLDELYPHLAPVDDVITAHYKREMTEAKQYARKLSVVILSERANEQKEDPDDINIDPHENNQKFGLCEALLMVGDWETAKMLMDLLPECFTTSYKPIATALNALLHYTIDPLYKKNSSVPSAVLKHKSARSRGHLRTVSRPLAFHELQQQVFPMVCYLGPHMANDPVLMVKIIRLGKSFMTKRNAGGIGPQDEVAYYGFMTVIDEVLLPSLTMMPCNCCMSEELWNLLRLYPYELRYRLYGQWKNDNYSQHAKLIKIRADCLERAKYIMKRLSKENVKPSGRQLGKLSHSNPGVLFEYVLSQIQRYDNFIGPVVDSLKFLTSLSYDILAFCIIEAVANPDKERMKHDDTNISLWLQSLASFAGSICRKYQVELGGLMQYVANQLKAGKSYDLLILREVVQKMAGIEISEEITDDQLEAMSGGELLRQEGGYFTQVRNTKKSSTRLKDALLDQNLALSLCLLMAQQQDGVIYQEGANCHLKLMGILYDQCHDTLVQFGSFLSMQLSTEEFVKRLPSINDLVSIYHLSLDAAFFLSRTLYSFGISAKYDELRKIDKGNKQNSGSQKLQRYIKASEFTMAPVVDLVKMLYSPKIWEDLSTQFYVTFWLLSIYDLCTPNSAYEKQVQQQKAQIQTIENSNDWPQSKKKKEKERCSSLIDKLNEERKKQDDHVARVIGKLKNDKESWFLSRSTKNDTITQFLQLCIFPRCCFTASDAVYCAKFIHVLHDLETPNFSTLICYDRIFCDITYSVSSCTENEAHRYGRFLCMTLETIMRWHGKKAVYNKECANYPGFVTVFRKRTDSTNKADQLDYENYRHVCHKWHFRITKAMVACLESSNYIQIRNALIVLTKLLPHYPRVQQFGQALERRVNRTILEEKDKRPDLYVLTMGYSGLLKSKKALWVVEKDFHLKVKDETKTRTNGAESAPPAAKENHAIKKEPVDVKEKSRDGKEKRSDSNSKSKSRSSKEKTTGESVKTEPSASLSREKGDKPVKEEKAKEKSEKQTREKSSAEDKVKIKMEKPSKDYGGGDEVVKEKVQNKESRQKEEGNHESSRGHRSRKEDRKEKDREGKEKKPRAQDEAGYKDKEGDRASSVGSNGSHGSHRRSAELSPRDERDIKRRKVDAMLSPSTSKAIPSRKMDHQTYRSPTGDWDSEREKKERKREHNNTESSGADTKRRRSEDVFHSKTSKSNGEPDLIKPRSVSKDREKTRDRSSSRTKKVVWDERDSSPRKEKSRDKLKEKSPRTSSSKKIKK